MVTVRGCQGVWCCMLALVSGSLAQILKGVREALSVPTYTNSFIRSSLSLSSKALSTSPSFSFWFEVYNLYLPLEKIVKISKVFVKVQIFAFLVALDEHTLALTL